jgi:hypothetical protein
MPGVRVHVQAHLLPVHVRTHVHVYAPVQVRFRVRVHYHVHVHAHHIQQGQCHDIFMSTLFFISHLHHVNFYVYEAHAAYVQLYEHRIAEKKVLRP